MVDAQAQPESDDRLLSIAADFARVLWSPAAVFRRRRATRGRRVLFVLWVIFTALAIPMFLAFVAQMKESERGMPLILIIGSVVIAPIAALGFVLGVAALGGAAVWLGSKALGRRLPITRAVVIAAFSSSVPTVFAIPVGIAFLSSGLADTFVESTQAPEVPAWMEALVFNLSPLAPESRPVLGLLLSFLGVPAIWVAALHAIGAREIGGVPRAVKFTLPVFWAASVLVMLVAAAVFYPIGRWAEAAGRAAERPAAEAADTIRAPATAP
jgi:hypothetical protein